MTHSTKLVIGLGVVAFIGVGACWEDGPTEPDLPSLTVVLSDTSTFATGAALAGDMASSSVTSEPEVAYVSLPAGSIPDGVSAVITNRRTQTSATTVIVEGGFDPVSIAARSGDTLETIVSRGNSASVILLAVVPRNRPPTLVRTIPPRGKKDVPLNIRISVVFSEPVDPASLTATSLRLVRGSTAVPGQILVGDEGLSVDFVPEAWLSDTTRYELVVSESIRDRDGEALGASVRVEFVTQEFSDAVGPIAFSMKYDDSPLLPTGSSIYVLENGQITRLTYANSAHSVGTNDGCPNWSPDGLRIAFQSGPTNAPNDAFNIHVMRHDGSARTTLTTLGGGCPAWSPDGTMLAFAGSSGLVGNAFMFRGIYVMNADGSGLRKITDQGTTGHAPTWSPDGRQIAFVGLYCTRFCEGDLGDNDFVGYEWDINIVNFDGTNLRRLSQPGEDGWPVWSPDGTTIAFMLNGGIHAMNPDGSNVRTLSSGPYDSAPSWSPDGKMIAFVSSPDSGYHFDIYVMNSDGSGSRRLTSSAGHEHWLSWSPARQR